MNIKSTFIGLLDNFIPVAIRNKPDVTREELVRTRAIVAILIGSILLPLVLLMAYVVLQAFTSHDFSRDIAVLVVVVFVLVSEHAYFQSFGNLRITAEIYSVQFLMIAIIATVFSGALYSPVMILLIASPVIAFMTMSYRAAQLHIVVVLLTIAGLLIMQENGMQMVIFGRAENYPYTLAMIWSLVLLIFMLFLAVFEELIRSRMDSQK
jgi:hypothetical protein